MTAKIILQKCKINIFHHLQDRVKASELSIPITHDLAAASLVPLLRSRPVFQAHEVLTVLLSAFIFPDSVPFTCCSHGEGCAPTRFQSAQ